MAAKTSGTTATGGISKMDAVRKTLAELGHDARPVTIQEHVKKKFGVEMTLAHVSTYKTSITRAKGNKSAESARKPATQLVATKAMPQTMATSTPAKPSGKSQGPAPGSVSLEDIEAVKALVGRLDAGSLKSLIDLMSS